MHRLLVDTACLAKDEPELPREAQAHLKVVRPKDGEEIELFDGRGSSRIYRYDFAHKALSACTKQISQDSSKRGRITLFACVTKGARWDWTLQKATELGAAKIVPVISERTIVRLATEERAAKRVRWQRVAEEAARQSHSLWIPDIAEPVDFSEALAMARETVCFAGALVTPPPASLLDAAAAACSGDGACAKEYSVFIGPEGDFSPDELKRLLEFAHAASFGSQVLRAETAAIYALAVLNAVLARQAVYMV